MTDGRIDPDVIKFFVVFERASADGDLGTLARCFLDSFLVGDAQDARTVAREAFLSALPGRSAAAAAAGIGPAFLTALSVEALDDHWVMARTRWSAPCAGTEELVLASTFLLRRHHDGLHITAYLNHEGLGLPARTAPSVPAPHTEDAGERRPSTGDDSPPAPR